MQPFPSQIKSIFLNEKFRDRSSSSPIPLPKNVSPLNYRLIRALARGNRQTRPPKISAFYSTDLGSFEINRPQNSSAKINDNFSGRWLKNVIIFLLISLITIAFLCSIPEIKEEIQQQNNSSSTEEEMLQKVVGKNSSENGPLQENNQKFLEFLRKQFGKK